MLRYSALCVLALIGCASTPIERNSASLEDRQWVIQTYLGAPAGLLRAPGAHAWIRFQAGAIEGSPSCGSLVGEYTIEGAEIHTTEAVVILAGLCPQRDIAAWRPFLDALKSVHVIQERGDEIVLLDSHRRAKITLAPSS
jgi:heat shock protein HslJ